MSDDSHGRPSYTGVSVNLNYSRSANFSTCSATLILNRNYSCSRRLKTIVLVWKRITYSIKTKRYVPRGSSCAYNVYMYGSVKKQHKLIKGNHICCSETVCQTYSNYWSDRCTTYGTPTTSVQTFYT